MDDKGAPTPRELLERERARLLEEAATKAAEAEAAAAKAAAVERDMAELDRIAARYNLLVSAGTAPKPAAPPSPLSVKGLAECYRLDERSPYHTVRPSSRKTYDKMIKQIIRRCGEDKVADLDKPKIQELYDEFARDGKIAMGHAFITKLRGLVRFGMNELKNADCKTVAIILHDMHFRNAEPRNVRLAPAHAEAIRAKAHELGVHGIAIAQAFQFHCEMRQKDVIGEWVPITDTVYSEILRGDEKWARGLRWNEIDDDWVLRHAPSAGGDVIKRRLTDFPVIMTELNDEIHRLGKRPKSGPIVVDQRTKQPYVENTFRWTWRRVADAANVPKTVKNKDSRPNAQGIKWEPESRMGIKK